ncbi:DUF397 domain-containing protein [Micromonospora sp. NPDC047548]|uniref:DUF397 domain-containing protein n=1 Tax=Micromonospora sp. NPDC047548 TaxID=3155624 RepID=UPI0033C3CD51
MDNFDNTTDPRFAGRWKKSSRSDGNGACVEVAAVDVVGVCDSKQGPNGQVLTFDRAAWTRFVAGVKDDQIG